MQLRRARWFFSETLKSAIAECNKCYPQEPGAFNLSWACGPGSEYNYWIDAKIIVVDWFGVVWSNTGFTQRVRIKCVKGWY